MRSKEDLEVSNSFFGIVSLVTNNRRNDLEASKVLRLNSEGVVESGNVLVEWNTIIVVGETNSWCVLKGNGVSRHGASERIGQDVHVSGDVVEILGGVDSDLRSVLPGDDGSISDVDIVVREESLVSDVHSFGRSDMTHLRIDDWKDLTPDTVREIEVSSALVQASSQDWGLQLFSEKNVDLDILVRGRVIRELEEEGLEEWTTIFTNAEETRVVISDERVSVS
jgi:hypothetical protein